MKGRSLVLGAAFAALLLFGCIGGPSITGVAATPVAGGIELNWDPVSGVAGYSIYRSTDGSLGQKINPSLIIGVASYKDTYVSDGITYYYTVMAVDAGGSRQASGTASATAKVAPPSSLSITVNGGANYTSQDSVTLMLSAAGASQCRLSNDGAAWTDWAPYSQQMGWQLTAGDGQKQVYYQCKDEIGNAAQPVYGTIYLDTVPPAITVTSPVQGGQYAGGFQLVFSITSPIANKVTCTGKLDNETLDIGIADTGVTYNISVPAAPGTHTMFGECSDGLLKSNRSATFTVTDKPYVVIVLGDGSGYTDKANVNMDVNASLASECRYSNDGASWNSWAAYSQKFTWQLTSGDGAKHVYAQCRSSTGTLSDVAEDGIVLDTRPPPYISVAINNGARRTNQQGVTLGLYAFAAAQCRFANDNTNSWSGWEPYSTRKSWTLSNGDGTKYVYYNCNKSNGDNIGTASASIDFFHIPPLPPQNMDITINNGDSSTASRNVNLRLRADYASTCRLREEGYSWSGWEDFTSSRTFTLSSGSGLKTVYYECQNDYGTRQAYTTIYLNADPPSNMQITINDGDTFTTSRNVDLRLRADHADSCRYKEQNYDWSSWEGYRTTRGFTVSDGDGQKTILYECRNERGSSSASSSIYLDTSPPPPITDLSAVGGTDSVELGWSAPAHGTQITEYRIFRSTGGLGLISQVGTSTATYYTDHDVVAGNTYNYWVRSVDQAGHVSTDSNTASAEVGLVGPVTPPPN